MDKSFKKFIKYYLIIGIIWGLLARFPNGIELSEYSGKRAYENKVTAVTNSYVLESGDLIICLKGQLAYSEMYPSAIKDFSITIPVNKIVLQEGYKSKSINLKGASSTALSIFDSAISEECKDDKNLTQIQVKQADYSPKKAYGFYSIRDLKDSKPFDDKEYMIYIVPTANSYYDGPRFADEIKVFLIMKTPDVAGRNYYKIFLEDTWIDRDIGVGEYAVAFLKDALFFPVWIVMMVNW